MKLPLVAAAALVLSGCSSSLPTTIGLDPADPAKPVPRPRYSTVTAGTEDHGPVDPKPWTDQNQSVAPQAGS
jgi:hypothetical protein